MAAPKADVRGATLRRDGFQCVRCGRTEALEMQHRQRVGAGGSKHVVEAFELATACTWCNAGFEAQYQTEALAYGWKVQAWVSTPAVVPMFDRPSGVWFLLVGRQRVRLSAAAAVEQMRTVYGPEKWDAWAEQLTHPIGLKGRVA